jgi:two-component system NtrC family response regulator
MADGGTLFLDEIGELPLLMQVKLLRFVQEQSIERIGGRSTISVDTRIVSATNVDLEKAMRDGEYREDLYYRLAVMVIKMPALRDRPGDIPLLAKVFLRRFKEQNNRASLEFSAGAIHALQGHDWPGNVRELENRVKRAAIMAEGRRVTPADLELTHRGSTNRVRSLKDVRTMAEREAVELAMQRNQGKISRAAQDLGISRPTLYELLEKLGLRKPDREEHE